MKRFHPLFIHQFPDWTSFRFDAQSVLNVLGNIRFLQGKLFAISNFANQNKTSIFAKDLAANFAIDNKSFSEDFIEQEILKKNNATSFIKNFAGAIQNAKNVLTLERLFAWHASLGQNKIKSFRTKENSITFLENTFTGVSSDKIPQEIEKFIFWFETSKQDEILKAAIAEFWFLTIRPFDDINGIIARTLRNMLLTRSENSAILPYALNVEFLKQKETYFKILSHAQTGGGDLTEWILFFLKNLKEALETSLNHLEASVQKILFSTKKECQTLSEREQKIIEGIFEKIIPQIFSVKEIAAYTKTSHDSALRDIQDLMQRGIVKAESKGGRSQKYSLIL